MSGVANTCKSLSTANVMCNNAMLHTLSNEENLESSAYHYLICGEGNRISFCFHKGGSVSS